MTQDAEHCLDRIERALARIENATATSRLQIITATSAPDLAHETRRVRTVEALAELDRVIGRLGAEAR